ncbi:aspartate aminotransferase family protein [Adhaeribacter soli]|uniref:Aspartate aminotransferase family protein n=1 Tax=Adhaeribacter soli TaxID=2607655 RepID=A0A5N1IXB9_9BACT|nr:aspartate aminotransferase family protein [Adhaeribacter soli]KAA9332712.1 aspartate aminotransferase family protein [Adhaeribacter soli]
MLTSRQLFLKHQAQTSDFPLMLEIEKAEGVYMYGANGEKYLDLISGIGVSNVGHRHPHVLKGIQQQLDKYMHLMVYGEFVQAPQVKLAEAISKTLPENLSISYFVNSGSEAVEGAMKLAKKYTGRTELISCYNAYHGSTQGSWSLTGSEDFKRAYRPLLPDVNHIWYNNFEELERITERTAAVFIETVQGEAGLRVAENNWLKAVRERCNQTGTLLVLDEIQCGFGRTGTFWAFEQFDVVPDILLCAKGMGGGMPIGAFISSEEIMGVFRNNPILGHMTTFGGHPVSCAASLATLEVIQQENLLAGVPKKAELFKTRLKHPAIKEIRNCGLMMAAEMESFEILKPVIDQAILDGVLTDWFLFCDNSMRIAPPLTISEAEIENACDIILKAMDKVLK